MDYPEKNFQCRLCGECCSGDMKVFLNPGDLKKMTAFLGLERHQLLLDQGWICLDRGQNGVLLPRISFKHSSGVKFCPFLENRIEDDGSYRGLCQLHPYRKPLVCAMAPFAREIDFEIGGERFYFAKPVSDCPGCDISEVYRLEQLFPQVDSELEGERLYYSRLQDLLDKSVSEIEILSLLFQLSAG